MLQILHYLLMSRLYYNVNLSGFFEIFYFYQTGLFLSNHQQLDDFLKIKPPF